MKHANRKYPTSNQTIYQTIPQYYNDLNDLTNLDLALSDPDNDIFYDENMANFEKDQYKNELDLIDKELRRKAKI